MVKWINCSFYKPGVAGSIPASPVCRIRLKAVAPSPYDLSCWWDVKHKHTAYVSRLDPDQAKQNVGPDLDPIC